MLISCLFGGCLLQLSAGWRFDPEYNYAWIIPLMVAVAVMKRMRDLPAREPWSPLIGSSSIAGLAVFGLVCWLPLRIIGRANPDWHMVSWAVFLTYIAGAYITLAAVGGPSFARHLAWPLLMLGAAVPWPYVLEQDFIFALKHGNGTMMTEALNLAGIPAVFESGGLIVLENAVLGIEDGCTGIRSLHLCLAVALFWGEHYRFGLTKRLGLVAGGVALAILVNALRTLVIALIAVRWGGEALHKWHDLAGHVSQWSTVIACGILAGLLLKKHASRFENGRQVKPGATVGELLREERRPKRPTVLLRSWQAAAAAVWLLIAETVMVPLWFGVRSDPRQLMWHLLPEFTAKSAGGQVIPQQWESVLAPDASVTAKVMGSDGKPRYVYGFQWNEGNPASLFATRHRPEICLTGSGFEPWGPGSPVSLAVRGDSVHMMRYLFTSQEGLPVLVYHTVYAHGTPAADWDGIDLRRERLRRAWRGDALPETMLMEIVLYGTQSGPEADKEAAGLLAHLVACKK